MQISRESNEAQYQITSYTADSITINEQVCTTSVLIMPQQLSVWPVKNVQDITAQTFLELIHLNPEIILIGTGALPGFIDPSITSVIYTSKIGLEVMTTSAACRTYTALTAEGRKVLAALII